MKAVDSRNPSLCCGEILKYTPRLQTIGDALSISFTGERNKDQSIDHCAT